MRKGKWSNSCPEKAPRPILAVRAQGTPSAHFRKLQCSEQSVSPLEMQLLTFLEHSKSKGDVMETDAMTVINQSAVKKKPF
jgi:hypothetical protein